VRATIWPLFAWYAWDNPANVVAGTTGEDAALASVRSAGVGSASHCGGEHDRCGLLSGLYSAGRRGIKTTLWWGPRQVRVLLRPLFARWAWAQNRTVVAGTKGEGATMTFDSMFGVSSFCHCSGWHDR
jgi:hypothetical protein